jgi:hypothetical protein
MPASGMMIEYCEVNDKDLVVGRVDVIEAGTGACKRWVMW